MFLPKLTNKQKEDLLLKLVRKLREIEFDPQGKHPESKKQMTAYKIFMSLPIEQKVSIRQQWTRYYELVKESPIYSLFQEQRIAAKNNDWYRVKELAQDVRLMRENNDIVTIKKPTSIDPWEFDWGWVKDFHTIEKRIKEIKEDLNAPDLAEQNEVWN